MRTTTARQKQEKSSATQISERAIVEASKIENRIQAPLQQKKLVQLAQLGPLKQIPAKGFVTPAVTQGNVIQGYFKNKSGDKLSEVAKRKIVELMQGNAGFDALRQILTSDDQHSDSFEDYLAKAQLPPDLTKQLTDAAQLKHDEEKKEEGEAGDGMEERAGASGAQASNGALVPTVDDAIDGVPWKKSDLEEGAGAKSFARMKEVAVADQDVVKSMMVGDVSPEEAALLSFTNTTESDFMHGYFGLKPKAIGGKGATKTFVKGGAEFTNHQAEVEKRIGLFVVDHDKAFNGGVLLINAHFSYDPKSGDEFLAGSIPPAGMAAMLFKAKGVAMKRLVILACAAENYTRNLLLALQAFGVTMDALEVMYVPGNNLFQPWPNPSKTGKSAEFFYAGPEVEKEEDFSSLQKPISSIFTATTGAALIGKKTAPSDGNESFRVQGELEHARDEAAHARSRKPLPELILESQSTWLSEQEIDQPIVKEFVRLMDVSLSQHENVKVRKAVEGFDKAFLKQCMSRIRKSILAQAELAVQASSGAGADMTGGAPAGDDDDDGTI